MTSARDLARQPAPSPESTRQLSEPTPRELQVVELIARGQSNREIAATLMIEESTVKTHVKRILKLDLRDRIHALIFAYETGLAQPGRDPRPDNDREHQSRHDPDMAEPAQEQDSYESWVASCCSPDARSLESLATGLSAG